LRPREASEIEIPGAEGDFTAMANHAATVTTMRPGVLKVKGVSETSEYVVSGGFVEISASGVSVLAETAMARGDVTREAVDAMVSEAETLASDATPELRDFADKRVTDTKGLIEVLGL